VTTEHLPTPNEVELRAARIEKVLGLTMESAEVAELLQRLGLDVTETEQGWKVQSPSWRFDVAIEADLLEEMARIYGYNRLPVTQITADLSLRAKPEAKLGLKAIRRQLLARGYQEAITYSFVDPKQQALVCPGSEAVELANPISADMAVMRTSLWTGLLAAAQHNLNRQQPRVRLFESGLTFVPGEGGLQQEPMLAGVITGRREPESWSENGEVVDFYDLKGDLESVFELAADVGEFTYQSASHSALHPGQSAEIIRAGEVVGQIGAIHPQLQKKLGLSQIVYLFEVKLSGITNSSLPNFTELSKFPEVRRDLAILIDREVPAQNVLAAVENVAGNYLRNLRLFDTYQGEGIDPKRKSLAFGLTFQHSSRTLNEDEVNETIEQVVSVLEKEFSATLRN
jgi:phenylalanyl-tRNA synthetase beta chain